MVLKLMEKVQAKGQVPSVIAAPAYYLLHIVREGITFLACARSEMSPLLGIEFLGRVADVLSDYLGGLNDDLIKDNFVIVYQVAICLFTLPFEDFDRIHVDFLDKGRGNRVNSTVV
jgi:hypothetical protein